MLARMEELELVSRKRDFVEQCYAMLDHVGAAFAPRADEIDTE